MTWPRSVVVAGGGTAGHIEPALGLADALRRADPGVRVTALGTARGLESRLVPERGYELALIPAVPLPRRLTVDLLRVPARLAGAVRASADILERVGADVVVGFGGYVALPAYLAARWRAVPFVVHESNARPGVANRIGARLTPYVGVAHSRVRLPHARAVGMPLRPAIARLDRAATRVTARAELGLDADRPTLLVFGGSQGARTLNLAVGGAAGALAAAGIQVLHVAGPKNAVRVSGPAGGPPYVVLPYLERMDLGYAAADLALCRCGAMTVAEVTAVGLPAIYVPLPHGNGEQRLNALPAVEAGAGLLVPDGRVRPDWVAEHVVPLLTESDRLARMAAAARAVGRPDGAEALAVLVREAAQR